MLRPLLTKTAGKTKQRIEPRSPPASMRSFQAGANPVLNLQRTLGNRRVAQLIKTKRLTPQGRIAGLQRKLTGGTADHQYEQEADQIARQVTSTPTPVARRSFQQTPQVEEANAPESLQSRPLPLAASITPFVQRQTENAENDKEPEEETTHRLSMQRQSSAEEGAETVTEEEENESIQAKAATSFSGSFDAGTDVESRLSRSKGQGSPLPDRLRAYMEPRFGVDFGHVRTHTGSNALKMNRDVGAQAFTHGSDIYYGAASSPTNLELTAHELTHVVQQIGGRPLQAKQSNKPPSSTETEKGSSIRPARAARATGGIPTLQRLSWSDLNPVEAAKNLANKAIGIIRSLGSAAWDMAKNLGSAAWNTVKNTGASAWDTVKAKGASVWNTVTAAGTSAWNTVKGIGTSAWSSAKNAGNAAWKAARGMGTKAWNSAKSLGSKAWDFARQHGTNAWNGAKRTGTALWDRAKGLGGNIWNTVKTRAGQSWDKLKGVGGKAWGSIKENAGKAYDTAKKWGGKAFEAAKGIAEKAKTDGLCKAIGWLAGKAYDLVAPYVKKGWEEVKKWGGKAWNKAKEWGGKLWSGAKSWAGKVGDVAKSTASKAYKTVTRGAAKAWDFAKGVGNNAITGAKQAASRAVDGAKKLGTGAWNFAKTKASSLYNNAKQLGSKVWNKAQNLGKAVWGKAQALGSQIAGVARNLGSKVLSIADRLTGGAASKVAGMARRILGKAGGLLSWVVNTAKELASRAINTAKEWASKALTAARDAASKAFNTAKETATKAYGKAKDLGTRAVSTAKDWGGHAWNTAKGLGAKAVSTAKEWSGKAWNTAKNLGARAWSTAKGWAGKAWSTAKTWGGKAWNKVQEVGSQAWGFAKKWGGKARDFAKGQGKKLLDVAKDFGLDKAWNRAKELGGKAWDKVKEAGSAIAKRFKGVIDIAKKAGEYLGTTAFFLNPATLPLLPVMAGCKVLSCAVPQLMEKGGSKKATHITDEATDLIPLVSTVKDSCGCMTGNNVVTGHEESLAMRGVRCVAAIVDIAGIVAGIFSGGTAFAGEQAAKTGIRAFLKRLFKIGGKELAEKGEREIAKQFARLSEKELADTFTRLGEKELREVAEQAARHGEKELAEKAEKELAKRAATRPVKSALLSPRAVAFLKEILKRIRAKVVEVLEKFRKKGKVTLRSSPIGKKTYEGAASRLHPKRFGEIIDDLEKHGVEINVRDTGNPWEGGYAPAGTRGRAGSVNLHRNVDIRTLEHEYKHFLDDKANGFPGLRSYLENPRQMYEMEQAAYAREMDLVRADISLSADEKAAIIRELEIALERERIRYLGTP